MNYEIKNKKGDVSMTEKKVGIRDYLSKIGPAVIVSMTIIGPGTMSALVTSGSGIFPFSGRLS